MFRPFSPHRTSCFPADPPCLRTFSGGSSATLRSAWTRASPPPNLSPERTPPSRCETLGIRFFFFRVFLDPQSRRLGPLGPQRQPGYDPATPLLWSRKSRFRPSAFAASNRFNYPDAFAVVGVTEDVRGSFPQRSYGDCIVCPSALLSRTRSSRGDIPQARSILCLCLIGADVLGRPGLTPSSRMHQSC